MRSFLTVMILLLAHAAGAADRVIVVQAPPRDWVTLIIALAPPLLTLGAVIVAIVTFRWSVKQWRWIYFTKEWSTLMQLLAKEAEFMDPQKAATYKTSFTNADGVKYDMIARLCIGYLDDLWFLGSEKEMRTWFRGSMRLFGGTHRAWLEDNRGSYDPRFYEFISKWARPEC